MISLGMHILHDRFLNQRYHDLWTIRITSNRMTLGKINSSWLERMIQARCVLLHRVYRLPGCRVGRLWSVCIVHSGMVTRLIKSAIAGKERDSTDEFPLKGWRYNES